jgi:PKD repeat protein
MKNYYILSIALILSLFINKVNAQCNPAFQPYINGNQVYFTTNNLDPSIAHIWHMGDGAIEYGNVTSHQYASAGQYQVKHVIRNASGVCYDSAMLMVVITADTCNINASITYQINTNNHKQVHFYGLPSMANLKYKWFFGDGTSSFSQNPIHTYQSYGQYPVKLIVQDTITNCVDTTYQNISVTDSCNLQANFTYNANVNNPQSFQFVATPNQAGLIYSWNFGDGNNGYGNNIIHNYTTPGTYYVNLNIYDSITNCSSNNSDSIIVNDTTNQCQLQASLSYSQQFSFSKDIYFYTQTYQPNLNYKLNFGDGNSVDYLFTTHHYATAGSYNVSLIVSDTNNNCRDTVWETVVITYIDSCNLQANFTSTTNSTNSHSVTFQSTGNTTSNSNYQWYFGDGYTANTANPTHTYNTPGVYAVALKVWDSIYYCHDSITKYVTISGNPSDSCNLQANFTHTTSSTNSHTVTFQSTGNTTSNSIYQWNFGDVTYANTQNATHTYNLPGTYAVGLTVWDSLYLCRDSITKYVTISGNASDSCTANFTYTINTGSMASFVAQSNQTIVSASWQIINPRDSSLSQYSNLVNPTIHLGDTGVYYVCVTLTTSTGCVKTYCTNIYNSVSGRIMPTNIKLFPNPVTSQLNVEFNTTQSGIGSYKIVNIMGNTISEKQLSFVKGYNKISIPVQQLHTGQYILTLQLGKESKKSNFLKL